MDVYEDTITKDGAKNTAFLVKKCIYTDKTILV